MAGTSIARKPGTRPEGPEPQSHERLAPERPPRTPGRITPPAPPGEGRQPSLANSSAQVKELQPAIAAAKANREMLLKLPHVIDVRAGYKFTDGRITPTPAVVVVVDRKVDGVVARDQIPPVVGGVLTDVAPADPFEQLRARTGHEAAAIVPKQPRLLIDEMQATGSEAFEEALTMITYEPPANGDLSPVTGAMTITCHVSPDAGWKVLRSISFGHAEGNLPGHVQLHGAAHLSNGAHTAQERRRELGTDPRSERVVAQRR